MRLRLPLPSVAALAAAVALILLLVGAGGADAATSSAAARAACKAPAASFAGRCVRPARGSTAALARGAERAAATAARRAVRGRSGAAARKLARVRRLFDGPRMRRAVARLDARARTAARRGRGARAAATAAGLAPRAAASAAATCGDAPDRLIPRETSRRDGLAVTVSGGRWGGSNGPISGQRTETVVEGGGVTVTRTQLDCVHWQQCPAADGALAGGARAVWEERRVAEIAGVGRVVVLARHELTARTTARVGADARAGGYDLVADTVTTIAYEERLADGRLFARAPTRTYRLHTVIDGLDPRAHGGGGRERARVARGPKGDRLDPDGARALLGFDAIANESLLRDGAARALLAAERNWYDRQACARLAVTTATPVVASGDRVEASARLTAADGEAAASGRYEIAWGAGTPGSGALPGAFALTVPERQPGRYTAAHVVATSPAGCAEADLELEVRAAPPRYRVSISGRQRFDWSYDSVDRYRIGTDAACDVHAVGSGHEQLLFATRGGDEGGAELIGGEVSIAPGGMLSAVFTRQGELTTSSSGPGQNCGGTVHEEASGCAAEAAMPDLAPRLEWEAGRLTLALEQYRPPALEPCPLRFPSYGRALDPSLVDASTVALPAARLAAGEQRIELRGSFPFAGHEDCDSPDAPGCTNDGSTQQRYDIDATKLLEWTIVLERVRP